MSKKFKKKERLTDHNSILNLIKKGKSFKVFPFYVKWIKVKYEPNNPCQIIFAIPKKKIKNAVTRNYIRRRSKEAYRLNKEYFLEKINNTKKYSLHILITYIDNKKTTYNVLEKGIETIIKKLIII